jgi:hypothetical protein
MTADVAFIAAVPVVAFIAVITHLTEAGQVKLAMSVCI